MAEIKKTMVEALAFVTEHGNMSAGNLEIFTNEFCVKKDGNGPSKPREFVKLFDAEGEMLGRKCSVTGLWMKADNFFKDGSMCKQADKVKAKLYTESKAMERGAGEKLEAARELTDPTEKLAAYEAYDSEMVSAKEHRLQDISGEVDLTEVTTYETIDDLASALGVEVITSKPKVETEGDEEE